MNTYDIEMEKAVKVYEQNEALINELEEKKIPSWNIVAKYTRAYRLKEKKILRREVLEFMEHLVTHNPALDTD